MGHGNKGPFERQLLFQGPGKIAGSGPGFSNKISSITTREWALPLTDRIILKGLKISCIIGIFPWERKKKQDVLLDLSFPTDIRKGARRDRIEDALDYKKIAKATIAFVEKSSYQLVETLAEKLGDHLLGKFGLQGVFLRVSKPGAIRGSQNVGVEITRTRPTSPEGLIYFSLGSNIDPQAHLSRALAALDGKYGLKALSHIYETSPVGGRKNQPFFWNMVAAVDTEDNVEQIRRWIVLLEKKEGRVRTKDRFGSRTLDVDLILWKDLVLTEKDLTLPHPDISTKAFVLFPLLEVAPRLALPGSGKPLMELAQEFSDKRQTIRQLRNLPPSTFNT